MNTQQITTGARQLVQAFGDTAHGAIDACRSGGERLGQAAATRWDRAFRESGPRLSAETRRNAANARKVVARHWRQGLQRSPDGADAVVDTLVAAAGQALDRAEALQARAARG